ncbi:MAG: hypothetical protein MUF65_02625 [Rubritepida sp.]|jgi:hypothetical protein|nr:hypothetical protein [Rubritepida sp.]MCU0944247.1 hypothetical protein [Rubritepida sp.]
MFFRLKRAASVWRLSRAIGRVRESAPLRPSGPGPLVISMLRGFDVPAYLLALKSFARQVPPGAVEVIDDGTLRPDDHALLRHHVEGLVITPVAAIGVGDCPKGGTWERLVHILDRSAGRYVVQLDADILTTGPLPEVAAAIAENRCFTLGTDPGLRIVSTAEAAAAVANEPIGATQVAAEQALGRLPAGIGTRYVRGSSGFAGFARAAVTRAQAEAFSRAMRADLGPRWDEWGTEQVASNFLVANAPGGALLPWPEYCCFYGTAPDPRTRLFHFLGTWRFVGGVYARRGREVAEALARGA